jgi:hypothetical protein
MITYWNRGYTNHTEMPVRGAYHAIEQEYQFNFWVYPVVNPFPIDEYTHAGRRGPPEPSAHPEEDVHSRAGRWGPHCPIAAGQPTVPGARSQSSAKEALLCAHHRMLAGHDLERLLVAGSWLTAEARRAQSGDEDCGADGCGGERNRGGKNDDDVPLRVSTELASIFCLFSRMCWQQDPVPTYKCDRQAIPLHFYICLPAPPPPPD